MPAPSPAPEEPRLQLKGAEVAARRLGEEMVMLDLRNSTYLSTNPAGTILWEELERGSTRSRLIARLAGEFDLTAERAGADVDAFLADLRRRDLLAEQPQDEVRAD